MTRSEQRLAGANLIVAIVALFGGVVTGLFQALEYAGVEVYPSLAPVIRSHYHSLSIHGVLNALVWTTFFICGVLPFIAARALATPLASSGLVGVGGALLFVSAMLYFLNMALTMVASRPAPQPALEFAEALSGADQAPAFLDRWRPWLALAALLIVLAYGPTLFRLAVTTPFDAPGFRVW